MKKIGIVTFHRSTSFGACLQAFATYKFLQKKGFEPEMVDYVNKEEQKFKSLMYKENGRLSGYITSLAKNVLLKKRYYAEKSFGHPEKYYKMSGKTTSNKKDLESLEYDVLVSASDQIWSSAITHGLDDVYLLQFGKAKRRISIASSMGSTKLTSEEHEVFKKAFQTFHAISVREPYAAEQLTNDTDKSIKILMDPTFLLGKQDWEEMLIFKSKYKHTNEKYILTFFVAPQPNYRERVQEYAKKFNLKVWSIQPTAKDRVGSDRIFAGVQIEDFVAMVKNASLVITDSFHGTALSLNMNTNFVSFKNVGNPVRVEALLKSLQIEERIDMLPENYSKVNYSEVNTKLAHLRKDSQDWIIEAVEG